MAALSQMSLLVVSEPAKNENMTCVILAQRYEIRVARDP